MIPVISIETLLSEGDPPADVAAQMHEACRTYGFFYVSDHGVDPALIGELELLARAFFALPEAKKEAIAMARAGLAWRGWFPLQGELTAGVPDEKEGIYFGAELGDDDERVQRGLPMHGANLFPDHPEGLRQAVLSYMAQLMSVGQAILRGLATGLGLPADWFARHLTGDPLILFRIFRYPPLLPSGQFWSVGEHTDYGLLTILGQDANGGLQMHTSDGWIDAPPIEGTFVCNLGDMLERLTGGLYRSTPHRVRNATQHERLSFPFFLDPSWDATVERLPIVERPGDDGASRWDHVSVHGFTGTYGDYIRSKVGRVFPALAEPV